ncbi:MAG TPA: hypothetical protein VF181_02555 [Balneolaceae bacterium]
MTIFLKNCILLFLTLIFIGCGSTDSGTDEQNLEDIIPNRTWYLLVPGTNGEQYAKHVYGDLNTTMTGTYHNMPCGTESYTEPSTSEYEVISNIKFKLADNIYDVLDYSKNQFRLEDIGPNEGEIIVFKSSCQELQ